MTDDDVDIEELKAKTQKGNRIHAGDDDSDVELAASIADALREIERGDAHKNLSLRDDDLAAILHGLEDHPDRLAETGEKLSRALDRDPLDDPDRSDLLRLAIRVGLREADPDVVDEAREAKKELAADEI